MDGESIPTYLGGMTIHTLWTDGNFYPKLSVQTCVVYGWYTTNLEHIVFKSSLDLEQRSKIQGLAKQRVYCFIFVSLGLLVIICVCEYFIGDTIVLNHISGTTSLNTYF